MASRLRRFSLERGDKLQDAETSLSPFDPLTGEAISGSMKGKRLQAVVSRDPKKPS